MKATELRELSHQEVKVRLDELLEESFNLRFQHVASQLSSPIRLRQVRREIACIRTLLQEHELGLKTLTGGDN